MSVEDNVVSWLIPWQDACVILLRRKDEFDLIWGGLEFFFWTIVRKVWKGFWERAALAFLADLSPTHSLSRACAHKRELTSRAQGNTCDNTALSAAAENNKLLHVCNPRQSHSWRDRYFHTGRCCSLTRRILIGSALWCDWANAGSFAATHAYLRRDWLRDYPWHSDTDLTVLLQHTNSGLPVFLSDSR